MCDAVPGQVILKFRNGDPAIEAAMRDLEKFGIHPTESLAGKIEAYGSRLMEGLDQTHLLIAVPEGDEVYSLGSIMRSYFAKQPPSDYSADFAVSLNNFLEPSALTYASGPHHGGYKAMLGTSNTTGDGSGVRVKIVDSGLSSASSVTPAAAFNLINRTTPNDVEDSAGHGTAVAEIIASMAPKADFLIYKVTAGTRINEWDLLAALSDNETAGVINLSVAFGLNTVHCALCGRQTHSSRSAVFEGTLRNTSALNPDSIIVAAAGNAGTQPMKYPARYRETISVGAVDSTGTISSTSSFGNTDQTGAAHDSLFFAPGGSVSESVGSISPGGASHLHGTSFAAAYASGLVAMIQSDSALKGTASHVRTYLQRRANSSQTMNGFSPSDHGNGLLQV